MKNNKQKLNLFTFLMLLFFANGFAQIVQKFGDDSFTIDANAVLELQSTNKGLLLPRVPLTSTSLVSPLSAGSTLTAGMTVYNTATQNDVTPGFYYYNGTKWVRVADSSSTIAVANGGTGATTAAGALTNLGAQSTSNLSSSVATNTGSTTMYPSVSAVETYVAAKETPDATSLLKGKIQLTGDLAGTAASPLVAAGAIDNSKISATAAIADTKLATIATAGKVSNSATTATSANTVSTIVLRDASGNFSAGAITATSFTGNGSALSNVAATSFTGSLVGDVTGTQGATKVEKINGTSLAGLSTGLLKNTTTTGVPTIAVAGTDYVIPSALGSYLPLTGGSLSGQLTSTVAAGTAPFVVTSTTAVSNLSIGGNAATATLATTATNATNTGITEDVATAVAVYPTFVTANTGNLPQKVSSTKLSFVPSTGVLTATGFVGSGAGLTNVTATSYSGTLPVANGGTGATTTAGALTNLGAQSSSNLSTNMTTDTGSTTKYPSVSAVQTYVTSVATPDASTSVKGKVKLAGDLAGTADLPVVAANAITSAKILDGEIVNADISATAAIADTKLATIATAGKVSNSATTATAVNTVSTIVLRDASGNFSAGAITATSFTGNGSALTNVVATTNANLTGVVTSLGNATSIADGALSIAKTSGLQTAIDGKVADAIIDGTTAVAPSQNAVFDALALKATIAAPSFTGDAKAVTPTAGDNDTSIATTAFVTTALTTAVNSPSVVKKTVDYTATALDSTILYDVSATAAGLTLTLPTAAAAGSGKVYVIKKIDATANKLNFVPSFYITTSTTDYIISSLNYVKTFRVQSDGSKWYIVD
jgi:hypothetical protein